MRRSLFARCPSAALLAALAAVVLAHSPPASAQPGPRRPPAPAQDGVTVRAGVRNDLCVTDPSVPLGPHGLPREATFALPAARYDWAPERDDQDEAARARRRDNDRWLHVPRARVPMPEDMGVRGRIEWVTRRRMRAPMARVASWIGERQDSEWWRVRARTGVVGDRAVVSARFESRRPMPVVGMIREDLVLDALQCPVHYPVPSALGPALCDGRRIMVTIANAESRLAMFVRAYVIDVCFAGPPRADGSTPVVVRPYVVRGEVRALPGVEQDDYDGARDQMLQSLHDQLLGGLTSEARLRTLPTRDAFAERANEGAEQPDDPQTVGTVLRGVGDDGTRADASAHADAADAPAAPPPAAVCDGAIRGATSAYFALVHQVAPGPAGGDDAFGPTDAALRRLWQTAPDAARDALVRFAELDAAGRARVYAWIDASLERAARELNDGDGCAHDLAYGHDRGTAGPRCAGATWSYYRPLVRWPPAADRAHTATLSLCRVEVQREDYVALSEWSLSHGRRRWYHRRTRHQPWSSVHGCSVLQVAPAVRVLHEGAAATLAETGQPGLGVVRITLDPRAGFTPYVRFVTAALRQRGLDGCVPAVRPLAFPDAPRRRRSLARAALATAPPR